MVFARPHGTRRCAGEDRCLAAAAKKASESGARPRRFFDYRRMLDAMHSEIDAVFVATPDLHHAPASMRAIQHGKHVFCEKPFWHDIAQARALALAARDRKLTTMMGNQGHCEEGYRRLGEYLSAGAIGDARSVSGAVDPPGFFPLDGVVNRDTVAVMRPSRKLQPSRKDRLISAAIRLSAAAGVVALTVVLFGFVLP